MFHGLYDEMIQFASEGELSEELPRAKEEFIARTGELFESDPSFERRIASFLEWYVFDRPLGDSGEAEMTPARLFVQARRETASETELRRMEDLAGSVLSLYEYRKAKGSRLHVLDLLTQQKLTVFERRKPAGLESGDILEARLIPQDDDLYFSEIWSVVPRSARRLILKRAKAFRKSGAGFDERIALIHRVAFLTNRCERYKHVDPREIFAEL